MASTNFELAYKCRWCGERFMRPAGNSTPLRGEVFLLGVMHDTTYSLAVHSCSTSPMRAGLGDLVGIKEVHTPHQTANEVKP